MKKWFKNYNWHMLSWAIFIAYEIISIRWILGIKAPPLSYVPYYAINICLFYVHADLILGRGVSTARRKSLLLILLILAELVVYIVISYCADQLISTSPGPDVLKNKQIDWKFALGTMWRGIYFILFATAYYFLNRYMVQKDITAKLEKEAFENELKQTQVAAELADAKNSYLKAQITPHFLFNTLTYIYNSTYKSEPRAAEAVRYLSKLMRYALECEHGPELMPLENEIIQVENLLQLSRIKQPDLYIDFTYDEGIEKVVVIPLVLLSLTENMIKHGNLSLSDAPGKIGLTLKEHVFEIRTTNLINTGLNDTGFHTGIQNIEQRLQHAYGETAEIKYGPRDNIFDVLVQIKSPSIENLEPEETAKMNTSTNNFKNKSKPKGFGQTMPTLTQQKGGHD